MAKSRTGTLKTITRNLKAAKKAVKKVARASALPIENRSRTSALPRSRASALPIENKSRASALPIENKSRAKSLPKINERVIRITAEQAIDNKGIFEPFKQLPIIPKPKSKVSYTIRNLNLGTKVSLRTFLNDMEKHSDAIDSLKKPEELWAIKIFGKRTYITGYSIRVVIDSLGDSASLSPSRITPSQLREVIENLRILRVNDIGGYIQKYEVQKERGRKKYKKQLLKEYKADVKREGKREGKLEAMRIVREDRSKMKAENKSMLRGIAKVLMDLKKQNAALVKQNKAQAKQLAKLSKPAKKAAKKVVKKIVKPAKKARKKEPAKKARKKEPAKKARKTVPKKKQFRKAPAKKTVSKKQVQRKPAKKKSNTKKRK